MRLKRHSGFVSVVTAYAPLNEEGNEEEAELQEVVCDVSTAGYASDPGHFNARVEL